MIKSQFYKDVVAGLTATPKYLPSKYFYDAKGDLLFEQIMNAPEYYLTNSDLEIFETQSNSLAKLFINTEPLDVLELGAGNAVKSTYLLQSLTHSNFQFTYYPIDISENIIATLAAEMPQRIPNISLNGMAGEYLEMTEKIYATSKNKKLLLFLGSSIGNFEITEAKDFLKSVFGIMQTGDRILIGFDLKKDPDQILAAYNDAAGITRDFNFNLLHRINQELQSDFDMSTFRHFPIYNPLTGACRSYLISKIEQIVTIPDVPKIYFEAFEAIDMELSQKFSLGEIKKLAYESGFTIVENLLDSNQWYCNAIWEK